MNRIFTQSAARPRRKFWASQIAPGSTRQQDTFDVIFAIVLPILCFVMDPMVFKGAFFGFPLLGDFQLVTYVFASVAMGVFLIWRTFRGRVSKFGGAFAAVFFLSAICSAVIGLALLPYSLFGLTVLIGMLGFIPFFTAFVFLRNGIRAAQMSHPSSAPRFLPSMLAGVLVAVLPVAASVRVERAIEGSVNTLVTGNIVEANAAADRLRQFPFVPDKYRHQIEEAYWREVNPFKRTVLKRAYEQVTGEALREWTPLMVD